MLMEAIRRKERIVTGFGGGGVMLSDVMTRKWSDGEDPGEKETIGFMVVCDGVIKRSSVFSWICVGNETCC
jgi:hypothetical protein